MFRFLKRLGGNSLTPVIELPGTNAAVFVRGTPANLESGLLTVGAAADAAFVGVVNETVTLAADGEMVEVVLALDDVVFEADYTGVSKTSLVNADIGTAFDLKSDDVDVIDLDDTTDGAWIVIGFDNDNDKAHVVLDRAKAANIIGG